MPLNHTPMACLTILFQRHAPRMVSLNNSMSHPLALKKKTTPTEYYTSCLSASSYPLALTLRHSGILCVQPVTLAFIHGLPPPLHFPPFLRCWPNRSTRPYIHHRQNPTTPAARKPDAVRSIQCLPIQNINLASEPCQLLPPCHRKKAHGCLLYSSPISTLTLCPSVPSHLPLLPGVPRKEETSDPRPRLYSCQMT